jgi:hypothetical protein
VNGELGLQGDLGERMDQADLSVGDRKLGGIVRRKPSSIYRYASRDTLKAEWKPRGYPVVKHGYQWLIPWTLP